MTHHPFARLAATPPYDFDLRRDVRARDRLVLPKQSAEPGTAGGPGNTRSTVSASGHAAHAADNSKASLDRAPLLRFGPLQHTPAAARCPGRPASGRSRFDVSPASPRVRTFNTGLRPCGFPPGRVDARVLAVADACGRSVPAESVACIHAFDHVPRQRLDGLLLASRSSSIVRAGGIGETVPHARERPGHLERRRFFSAARAGSCADAFLGAAFRYPNYSSSAAWPGEWSFPRFARRRSWGSSLRRFTPAGGWMRRANSAATR